MIPDCTLTTACFDLTKYNPHCRDLETTLTNMTPLLQVPCYLIIYTDPVLAPHIQAIRNDQAHLAHLTHYIVMEVESLASFAYRDIVTENRKHYHPTRDERTCPESHLVCCSKFDLVLQSIRLNPFHTSKFGWIDANVGPNFSKISMAYKSQLLLNLLHQASPDKFHLQILNVCDKRYILENNLKEYYSTYQWVVCGCLFLTGKHVGERILTDLHATFVQHTVAGYGHGEEMFYLPILERHYDDIHRSYGDYHHLLHNFADPSVGFDYIQMIATKYLNYQYYKECIDCCSKVIARYENFEVSINYQHWFQFLFTLYVASYYADRENAPAVLSRLRSLIELIPACKEIYQSNQGFYDSQFSFV
jgi:hypothetical protein